MQEEKTTTPPKISTYFSFFVKFGILPWFAMTLFDYLLTYGFSLVEVSWHFVESMLRHFLVFSVVSFIIFKEMSKTKVDKS
jgi:hypothetical protein